MAQAFLVIDQDTWSVITFYNNVISHSEERLFLLRCEAVIKGCKFHRWNLAESRIFEVKEFSDPPYG